MYGAHRRSIDAVVLYRCTFRVERCVDQSYKLILNLAFMGAIDTMVHIVNALGSKHKLGGVS